jgi:hypothetical protein
LAADSLGFRDQSTHFAEQRSSAPWVCRALQFHFLRALQSENQKHNLSTFKHFGTVEQFKFHITDDVLPSLLDNLAQSSPLKSD